MSTSYNVCNLSPCNRDQPQSVQYSVIDELGREVPITEQMIEAACQALESSTSPQPLESTQLRS